jgi:signal transduction histidine kinase
MGSAADRLREVPVLASLSDEEVARLTAAGRERRLAEGEFLFYQGDPATAFHIVLEGKLETTREVGGEQMLMFSHGPGGFLGAMALLTDTPYRGTTFAVVDTILFEVDGEELRRLAFTHGTLMRQFLPAFESVSGTVKGVERDREKLLAVGQLAAGLAHELNNPAAAAARAVPTLREYERQREQAFAALAQTGADAGQLTGLVALGAEAADPGRPVERLDSLAESDLEEELLDVLDERGVPEAHMLAAALTEAGLGVDWVERIAATAGAEGLSAGLRYVAASAAERVLTGELADATTRIVSLVAAVKNYSYLDQAPRQTVVIHEGLESTIALLAHKLKAKRIEVVRDFDPDLPTVEASGSELNQVWTNLIDNAIDAVDEQGQVTVRTRKQGQRISVEICDNGPGIPADLKPRVFDAFFTTKPVGQGTGLGLDIAQRIVVRDHGELRLESEPGDTRFQVLLPTD